ncbi:MAG TPA: glycosyltransferase family 87 protein [Bellilinea sp.]|jgi:hypothetical protein|nr:glycosyltransferase family 87 protein [Bellilinea sp.]
MSRRNPLLLFVLSFTAALALFALLVWGNMRFAGENAGGEDFLMRWDNAREFVRNGVSPYSDQAAESAEVLIYGHTAQTDAERMVASYPLYALVVYLPMTLVEDPIVARAIWMAVLEVAVLAAAILSVYLSGWRVKPLVLLIFLFFSVFWYHGFRPIVTGEITPLVTLLVVSALLAVKNEHDELAGVLFGLAMLSPEMVLVLLVFVLFWGVFNGRIQIFLYALGTFALLCGLGFLLIPDWPMEYLRTFFAPTGPYFVDTIAGALGIFLPTGGARVGGAISILIAIVMVVEWFINRGTGYRGFLWTACFTIVASFWVGIKTSPDNFILALPALTLVFAGWTNRWRRYGSVVSIITMLFIFTVIWLLFLGTFSQVLDPFIRPVLFFPLPFFAFILLYWVRWWTIHPPQVWFDNIR